MELFAGKTQSQIYDYQKNDLFIGRPTKPFSKGVSSKIKFEFEYSFDNENFSFSKRRNEGKKSKFKGYSIEIEKCMKIFDLENEFNEIELKKRYKELVKKYHPDLNKNYLDKDKNIKEINKSYTKLINFLRR